MATATARGFGDDGNGQNRNDEIMARARAYMAEGAPADPETIQHVGRMVVARELTPAGWSRLAVGAGYIALRRVQPQFNTPVSGDPPASPHG